MRLWVTRGLWGFSLLFYSLSTFGASRLADTDKVRKFFGLSPAYDDVQGLDRVKVAVLDTGFGGVQSHPDGFPASTVFVDHYDKTFIQRNHLGDPNEFFPLAPGDHGRRMAQIIWGVTGNRPDAPRLYLLNANGITNFKRAVRYAIEQKVDIILYSQNWECCGNFDGRGFINQIVNEATTQGILWINAAGNYGRMVYNAGFNSEVSVGDDGFLRFGDEDGLKLTSNLEENPVQIILTWNAFTDDETDGTDRDLDLFVVDENGKIVASSQLKQVKKRPQLAKGETFLAREKISVELGSAPRKHYRIRVLAKSRNFGDADRLRITVIPSRPPSYDPDARKMVAAVEFPAAQGNGEIMVPADNASVVTVGDLGLESSRGPTIDDRQKPDLLLRTSAAGFTDGLQSEGTSNAAAYFAGIAAVLKASQPGWTRESLMRYLLQLPGGITPLPDAGGQPPEPRPQPQPQPDSPDERSIPLQSIDASYDAILRAVDQLSGGMPIQAFQKRDGQIVLRVERIVPSLAPLFPQWNPMMHRPEEMEFYLVRRHISSGVSGIRVFGYARVKDAPGARDPWDFYHEDPRVFVELAGPRVPLPPSPVIPREDGGMVPVGSSDLASKLAAKIWVTPLPDQLATWGR